MNLIFNKYNLLNVVAAGLILMAVPPACAQVVDETSLESKIGAMIIVGFQGKNPEEEWPQKLFKQIQNGQVGGVIFFSHNIKWPRQFRPLMEYLKLATAEPVFFAIDQEGGRVERLAAKNDFQSFLSAKAVAKNYSSSSAYEYYQPMAKMIADAGFNLDFAPVVDLDYRMPCPVIGGMERSYSTESQKVVAYAKALIRALHDQKVLSCIKHFPGHGSLSADTHRELGDLTQTWRRRELNPFYQTLQGPDAADMVMAGHLIHRGFDDRYPATLSPVIIKKFLREQAGYDGVVVSDDLHMGAILKNYGLEEAVVRAINAGIDILVFSNNPLAAKGVEGFKPDPDLPLKVRDIVLKAIAEGKLNSRQIDKSYERIQKLRQRLALDQRRVPAPREPVDWPGKIGPSQSGKPRAIKPEIIIGGEI